MSLLGVFGTPIHYRHVKECSKRGSGHIHGQHHGGANSALFADVADDAELLTLLLDGLGTQLQAELPIEYHLLNVARTILRVGARRDAASEIPAPDEKLMAGDPPIGSEARRIKLEEWWTKFQRHAMLVVANRNVHKHQSSCLAGKQERLGVGLTRHGDMTWINRVVLLIYRYSTTESLYLFTPDGVRVPRSKTKRLLPGLESVAKNWPKECLVKGSNSDPGKILLSEATPLT